MSTPTRTMVGVLRVRASAPDPALRLRVTGVLGTADVRPPGLPPSSILIVRRMADPLPGLLAADSRALRVNPRWQQALREELATCYRRAARPALGDVWPDADAVLLTSEAELLACLLLDVQRGLAHTRWWWAAILRELPTLTRPIPVAALLLARPRLVPAALQLLAWRNEAVRVVASVPPAKALEVLSRVAAEFDCALSRVGLPPPLPLPPGALGFEGRQVSGADEGPATHSPAGSLGAGLVEPPWQPVLGTPLAAVALAPAQRLLLAVALVLHRAPGVARSRAFRAELAPWLAAAEAGRDITVATRPSEDRPVAIDHERTVGFPPPGAAGSPLTPAPPTPRPRPARDAAPPRNGLPEAAPPPGRPPVDVPRRNAAGSAGTAQVDSAAASREGVPRQRVAERTPLHDPAPPGIPLREPGTAGQGSPEGDEAAFPAPAEAGAQGAVWIETRLGGAFYLINVMTDLGLPDCFEASCRLARDVGAWGVLEALARGLLGDAHADAMEDPLWRALAKLSRRSPDAPGGALLALDAPFVLPVYWQELARQGRVEGDDAPLEPLEPSCRDALAPPLARWLARALPFVRLRLRQALGPLPVAELLTAPGRVYITSSHVDLVLPMESISLPARVAGLDRDPGWIPAFGRVVLFHFEVGAP
jgi:hypothetical protein